MENPQNVKDLHGVGIIVRDVMKPCSEEMLGMANVSCVWSKIVFEQVK